MATVVMLNTRTAVTAAETATFCGIEMVLIPDNKNLTDYYIGKYEVTQKQYESVMGTNPAVFKGKPDNPVENICWYDAIEFCNRLSVKAGYTPYYNIDKENRKSDYTTGDDPLRWDVTVNEEANGFRLPTEAEWNYAYNAYNDEDYLWGKSKDFLVIDQYAVYDENSLNKGVKSSEYGTHRVGTKKPNAWGLYDMSGNVWEFCYDISMEIEDIRTVRVLRGGGWKSDGENLRFSCVDGMYQYRRADDVGLRIARTK